MNDAKTSKDAPTVTESMVRRFCEAQSSAEHGEGCNCRGEYHEGIAAGLRAALSGKGRLCAPYMCPCETPTPDPTYHNICNNPVDENGRATRCFGFIKGVSEYVGIDGRVKRRKRSR